MKKAAVVAVLVGLLLAACSSQPATSNTENSAQFTAIPETQAAGNEQPSSSELVEQGETANTQQKTPEALVLDPLQTYEMIASVHANILMVESWLIQGINDNQREAWMPIAEMGIFPLGAIFETYTPQPGFAEAWLTAQDINTRLFPQLDAWLNGELGDDLFEELIMELKIESNQLITDADQIAFQDFDIDVAEYQPDYSLAMGIVFQLAVSSIGQQANPHLPTDLLADSEAVENPDLVVSEVTPITYQFAGSDLLLVVGLVENTGSDHLELAEVEVSFYNEQNEYLGTMWGTTSAILIEPGNTYPFSASLVTDGDDIEIREQWASYQVTAAAHPLTYTPQAYYQDFDLVLESVTEIQPGEYRIQGTLTNLGAETVNTGDIFISAAGFNIEGRMVGFGKGASIQDGVLAPGESIPFEVVIQSNGGEPVSYQFTAEVLLVP